MRYYNLNAKDAKLYINHNFYDKDNARCIDLSDCNNVGVNIDFFHRYSDDTPDIKVIGGKNLHFTCHSSDYDLLDLDFSNTDKLTLNAECWGIKGIKFKEGSSLRIVENYPKGLDLTMFDEVEFNACLPNDVVLKDGVKVRVDYVKLCNDVADFSKCGQVMFGNNIERNKWTDKKTKFIVRDKAQLKEIKNQLSEDVLEVIVFENKSSLMNKIATLKKTR